MSHTFSYQSVKGFLLRHFLLIGITFVYDFIHRLNLITFRLISYRDSDQNVSFYIDKLQSVEVFERTEIFYDIITQQ